MPILTADARALLLHRVAALVPAMAARAGALDETSCYPAEDMAALRDAGVLGAVCPAPYGGLGLGTEAEGAQGVLQLLHLLGQGSMAVGRLIEAHINALKLVCAYGHPHAVAACCADAQDGHVFGLWVTGDRLRLEGGVLRGGKDICSGAGFATRALLTVDAGGGAPAMMVADVSAGRPGAYVRLTGMRAACNAPMDLDGLGAGVLIGQPGDYLRQPIFSAGAWRTSAVTLGGIEALVDAVAAALVKRGRADDPHQATRLGQMKIAQHTAYLWMHQAALVAENEGDADDITAFVNLARVAVERAGLEIIRLAQQCLGLGGMVQGAAPERIMRDLATYLRQPAGDQTLTEAAGHFARNKMPVP